MKSRQELEKYRRPWPDHVVAEMKRIAGDGMSFEPTIVEDKYGIYSTGMFIYKGKEIFITIDDGLWHLSASTNHTIGYYELKELRYEFMPNTMFVAQIFPPREEFVNIDQNCFHLWQLAPGAYADYPGKPE
jgi:hypothetical protein